MYADLCLCLPVVLNCVGARNNRTFVALVACILVGQVLFLRLVAAYERRILAAHLGIPASHVCSPCVHQPWPPYVT